MMTERIIVSTESVRGVRESQPMQVAQSVVDEMDWTPGVDNTPWKQPCLVSQVGDTIYYRYPNAPGHQER